jgi:hypothetical protein
MAKTIPPSSFVELSTKPQPTKINTYTQEDRQAHCKQWRKSGLSMSEYCRRHQLRVSSLSQWVKRSKNKDASSQLEPPLARAQGVEVRLMSGSRLFFSDIRDADAIVHLVKAFDACG